MSGENKQVVPEEEVERKLALITRNLQEVMGDDKGVAQLRDILRQRDLKIYWGTATTGAPHIAYFVPMCKIADFLSAGCEVTILFADLHAYLDNMKSSWELLVHRTLYYECIIKEMLRTIGVPLDKLKFVRGTEYQLSKDFTLDVYKASSLTNTHKAQKAGAEVVKQVDNPLLSGLLYPLLQALDEQYLGVDAQFGGVDQRKIFALATELLPVMGYEKRIHLMNPMVPGLSGAKMSSSEKNSKIGLLDTTAQLQAKIKQAFCEEGNISENGVLSFIKMVLFPIRGFFEVVRPEKFGGNAKYEQFQALEDDFRDKKVFPLDLKNSLVLALDALLAPIRKAFETPEMQAVIRDAYPDEAAEEKKEKEKDPKPAAAPKGGKGKGKAPAMPAEVDIRRLDLRVGRIAKIAKHPTADTLYVEEVELGEEKCRTVVSGLASAIPIEQLEGRMAVFLCNMKPSSLRGIKSEAMLLAAASADKSSIEIVDPPAGAKAGEPVTFPGFEALMPNAELPRANEKVLAAVIADLHTDDECIVKYKDAAFTTSAGVCTVKSLKNTKVA